MAVLSEGSLRSSRVVRSPVSRTQAVSPAGPPRLASNRLAAPLSLRVTAAAQSSPTLSAPSPRCASVTGETPTRSAFP